MVKIASYEYKELKKETSRMASMANKRLRRLERNELTELPAYKSWVDGGSIKFSVAGKNYNELQAEFWRLQRFLDNKTSTVRNANLFLKEMAKNTGIKYNSLKELKDKSTKFFELANKVRDYYKSANESARALDYQKIWEQINEELESGELDISDEIDNDEILQRFIDKLSDIEQTEQNKEGFSDDGNVWEFIDL